MIVRFRTSGCHLTLRSFFRFVFRSSQGPLSASHPSGYGGSLHISCPDHSFNLQYHCRGRQSPVSGQLLVFDCRRMGGPRCIVQCHDPLEFLYYHSQSSWFCRPPSGFGLSQYCGLAHFDFSQSLRISRRIRRVCARLQRIGWAIIRDEFYNRRIRNQWHRSTKRMRGPIDYHDLLLLFLVVYGILVLWIPATHERGQGKEQRQK